MAKATLTQAQRKYTERFIERDSVPVMIFKKRERAMWNTLIEKGFVKQVSISHTGQHAVMEITPEGKRALAE